MANHSSFDSERSEVTRARVGAASSADPSGVRPGVRRARSVVLLVAALCLISLNMRATITGVGPLLDQIGDDTGLDAAALGLLAALPILTWACVSPFAQTLSARFGLSRVVLAALVVLTLGTIWRSLPGSESSLWAGTAVIGVALAVANVLMPAVVKRDFPARIPVMMAVYTAVLSGFGALASGVVVPLSNIRTADGELGWRWALALTGILLPVAIAVWSWEMRGNAATSPRRRLDHRPGIWLDGRAWLVAGYMGTQSAAFYILVTWLAPISVSVGRSEVIAGLDVMAYQVAGIAGSFLVPLTRRGRLRPLVPALVPAVGLVSCAGILLRPDLILVWALLSGLAAGAALGMALTIMAESAADHPAAAALSGMAQSVGYGIAALGPVLFGWLHQLSGGWAAPIALLAGFLVAQLVVGALLRIDRQVLEDRPSSRRAAGR